MTAETRPALRYDGFCDLVDISAAQVIYDAQAIADDGFVGATVKSSEGVFYCDPHVLEHLKKLRGVGLICNTYTFLRPSQGHPREQVRKAFECSGDEFPMRLALDLEGAPDDVLPEALVAFGEDCVDECMHNGALLPELYSFPYFVKQRLLPALASSALLTSCPLWMAHYGSNDRPWLPPPGFTPYLPPGFSTWAKHQYSGNNGYRVRGIYGDVDRDLFHGDLHAFRAYMGLPDDRPTVPDLIVHPAVPLRDD